MIYVFDLSCWKAKEERKIGGLIPATSVCSCQGIFNAGCSSKSTPSLNLYLETDH